MLDCITGGRLISGMVRGIGAEYYSMGVNPAFSHARFQEAHDLVVQSLDPARSVRLRGQYYHFEYVNVWPRPYQQPHPPIWAPSTGSTETIEWAAHPSRKYVYLQAYSPIQSGGALPQLLPRGGAAPAWLHRELRADRLVGAGLPLRHRRAGARGGGPAHRDAVQPAAAAAVPDDLSARLSVSAKSLKNMLTHKRSVSGQEHTVDTLIEQGIILCGSPDTVRKQLMDSHRLLGFQNLLALLQFATLPRDLTEKNIRLFAREVMPALQGADRQGICRHGGAGGRVGVCPLGRVGGGTRAQATAVQRRGRGRHRGGRRHRAGHRRSAAGDSHARFQEAHDLVVQA